MKEIATNITGTVAKPSKPSVRFTAFDEPIITNNPKGKNPGDMWEISLKHSKEKHFAQFPLELPDKIIQAFCPKDGVVLDTFAGSGTTGLAAIKNNVKSIMIELNPEFCKLMETRFK